MKYRVYSVLLALALLLSMAACGSAPASEQEPESKEEAAAVQEPEPEPEVYEVRFEMNGGTLVAGQLLQRVEKGQAAEEPQVQRDGYEFDGWSEPSVYVTGNMVVLAQWVRSYSISFDPAGGEVVSGETEQQVREGDFPNVPEVTLDGADFEGWSPEVDVAGEDTIYVAQWSARKLSSEEIFDKVSPAVVEIVVSGPEFGSLGSGFFIDDQGTVVTNYHVIDGTLEGTITTKDGDSYDIVAVLDYDPALDLAILKTSASDTPYLNISEQDVTTGETVYTLGSSQGLTGTFSDGIVSTASRDMEGVKCIQITAPISQGNSGGPLLNIYGEVVGINSMTLATGQNLNFAIDVDELQNLDPTGNMTLAEVFDAVYPAETISTDTDEGFYDVADLAEVEPNDSFLLPDALRSGAWMAGMVSDVDDLDWFSFELAGPADVTFEVAPYYKSDSDYLLCGIMEITDDGVEVVDALVSGSDGSYEVSLTGTVHFDAGGIYFLMVCVDDEYPYKEPVYYTAQAIW